MFLTPSVRTVKLTRSLVTPGLTRSAADTGFSWEFRVDQLPSYTELSSLFARVRIDRVDMNFTLTAVAGTATTVQYPVMYIAVDYTDVSVPGSLADIQQRKHLELQFNSAVTKHVVKVRPRVNLGGIIQPTSFTSGDYATPWYGCKAWIYNYNSTSADGRITLIETFHLTLFDEQ